MITINCDLINLSYNSSGRIYSKESIEKAIASLKDKEMYGTIDRIPNAPLELKYITHKINNLNLNNDVLECEATVLDTPMGKIVQKIINNDYEKYHLEPIFENDDIKYIDFVIDRDNYGKDE